MDARDIKSFKIKAVKSNNVAYDYSFRFRGDSIDEWSYKFFYLYARMNWPDFEYEMNKNGEYTLEKVKENKERYLELVKNFILSIRNNNYGTSRRSQNWWIEDIKIKEPTWIQGAYNNIIFYLKQNDNVLIKTPTFKNISFDLECKFEKELLNANFYLKNYIWLNINKPNPYLTDKEFIKKLENVIETARDENWTTFINTQTVKEDIRHSLNNKLTYTPDNFKDTQKRLTDIINDKNINLTIAECENISNFVSLLRQINRLEEPNRYNNYSVLSTFKDFLKENEYLKKPYISSLSKEELTEIMIYKEEKDYTKVEDLKGTLLLRFFKNNQKTIIDLFLENKILSVNLNKEMLKENQVLEEIER